MASDAPRPELGALRHRIDELDRALVAIVAERLAVCEEVARLKEGTDMPVIQPARVRDVLTSRRQWAIDAGTDPDFAEQLFRALLAETHRIEVAGRRPDAAPDKAAAPSEGRSALDTVATRIDHVVVAVHDLAGAIDFFTARLGFHTEPLAGGESTGIAALTAGGVTVVLVGAGAGAAAAPLPGSARLRRAAHRHRGARRRRTPGHRSTRPTRRSSPTWSSTSTATSSSSRSRIRPPACRSGSSPARATASASARPTCWRCSTVWRSSPSRR